MPLLPDWAPNLHPLIVHLPIALLPAAGAVDLASLLRPDLTARRDTATWLYIAGAGAAIAAYWSGVGAAADSARAAGVSVEPHATWAFGATWTFAFFASLRLAMSYLLPPARALRIGAFAVALAGLGALGATAVHGHRLVFDHGVGVRPADARGGAAPDPRPPARDDAPHPDRKEPPA